MESPAILNGIYDCKKTYVRYVFVRGRRIGQYARDMCGSQHLANSIPYVKMNWGHYPDLPQNTKAQEKVGPITAARQVAEVLREKLGGADRE